MKKRLATLAILTVFGVLGTASAAVIGVLDETNCAGGGATVNATTITWSPVGTVAGTGCVAAGISTAVTWSGGTIAPGNLGNILNLTFTPGATVDGFMRWNVPTLALDFVETSFPAAVSTNGLCSNPISAGQSCVLVAGYTPFLLTYNGLVAGVQNTQISAQVGGTVADPGTGQVSTWGGSFNTTLNQTPAQIEATFLSVGSISSTQEGRFTIAFAAVPEPSSMLMIGGGLIGLATLLRKRLK
jgi:hypothetical protein